MASASGTRIFNLTVAELMEDAFLQCGRPTSAIGAEDLRKGYRQLNLLQMQLINRGINLWSLGKFLVGLYPGIRGYDLPTETVDLLSVNRRIPVRVIPGAQGTGFASDGDASLAYDYDFDTVCQNTIPSGYIGFTFSNPSFVSTVGFRLSLTNGGNFHLVIEASNDGINYDLCRDLGAQLYADNTWYWYDVEGPRGPYTYWRVRETGTNYLGMRELVWSISQSEIQCSAYNRDDYYDLPNKETQGDPLNFWYDRSQPSPKLYLWPAPINTYNCISILSHRYIEDVDAANNILDIPTRWLDAITKNLAFRLAKQLPDAAGRIPFLKQEAVESMAEAEAEESDKSPIYMVPVLRYYQR